MSFSRRRASTETLGWNSMTTVSASSSRTATTAVFTISVGPSSGSSGTLMASAVAWLSPGSRRKRGRFLTRSWTLSCSSDRMFLNHLESRSRGRACPASFVVLGFLFTQKLLFKAIYKIYIRGSAFFLDKFEIN